VEVNWTYSVAMEDPGADDEDAFTAVDVLGQVLQSQLEEVILSCDNFVRRRLASSFGISALDLPKSTLTEEGMLLNGLE